MHSPVVFLQPVEHTGKKETKAVSVSFSPEHGVPEQAGRLGLPELRRPRLREEQRVPAVRHREASGRGAGPKRRAGRAGRRVRAAESAGRLELPFMRLPRLCKEQCVQTVWHREARGLRAGLDGWASHSGRTRRHFHATEPPWRLDLSGLRGPRLRQERRVPPLWRDEAGERPAGSTKKGAPHPDEKSSMSFVPCSAQAWKQR